MDTIKTLIQENTMSILKMWELQSKDAHLPLAPEDKLVSKKRAFEKLSSNHQRLILNMHSDGSSVPSQACTTCIDILHAKTGPNVVNFLTCLLSNEDFALARGMPHNLGHAQVFSKTPSEIDNVSPFYVHLRSQRTVKGVNQEKLYTIELLHHSNTLQSNDVADMIKNDIFVSGDFHSFKQQIANHTLIWGLYAGENSYLAMSLSAIDQHISDNPEAYREYIQNDPLFIVSFLHDIHFRLQRFFKSLVLASSVEDIRFEYVNFSDMLLKVDMRNYSVQSPTWYKQLTVKKDKDSSSNFRKGSDHHQLSDDNSRRKVPEINQNVYSACKLMDGERWGAIFTLRILRMLLCPKLTTLTSA